MTSVLLLYILSFIAPLIIGISLYPFHIKFMLKKGIYGIDVHKENKPKVAEMGGLIILFTIIIGAIIAILLVEDISEKIIIGIFCVTVVIAGGIGIIDDIKPLSAILKPLLLIVASIPIIITKLFVPEIFIPKPKLPFVGETSLTIFYWVLLPFVISVPANAVNMLDVFNGSMATTTILMLIAIFIANGLIFGFGFTEPSLANIFVLITFGAVLAFWIFNRYPAKVFSGDTGSLTVGAALGAIAVIGRLEIVVIIAMIPLIMNAFGIISSVRGLRERREMVRPTIMTKDWKLEATADSKAPITLAGLVLQKGAMREDDVVKGFNILVGISSILAILTGLLIWLTEKFMVG